MYIVGGQQEIASCIHLNHLSENAVLGCINNKQVNVNHSNYSKRTTYSQSGCLTLAARALDVFFYDNNDNFYTL